MNTKVNLFVREVVRTVRSAPVAFVFLTLGIIGSFYVYSYTVSLIRSEEEAKFSIVTKELKSLVASRYNRILDVPRIVGAIHGLEDLTDLEFTHYIQSLELPDRYPGIEEVGVITHSSKNAAIATPHRFPVGVNRTIITSTTFSSAQLFSSESDQGLVTLSVPGSKYYAIIVPIVDKIKKDQHSFLYVVITPNEVFNRLFLENSFYGALDFKISDMTNQSIIFDSSGLPESEYSKTGLVKRDILPLPSVSWGIVVHANNEVLLDAAARRMPSIIRIGGIFMSLLIFVVLFVLGRSREQALALAQQMNHDLKKSEEKYKNIFNSLQDVYYRTDTEGNIITVSPSIQNYVGISPETIIGKSAIDFYKNPTERVAMLTELMNKGKLKDYPLTLRGRDGKDIFVSLNARVLLDPTGKPVGVEGLLRDVSERKIAEDEVLRRTKELERMNSLMIGRELRMIELKKALAEKTLVKKKTHAKKKL